MRPFRDECAARRTPHDDTRRPIFGCLPGASPPSETARCFS
jgi:hypothetical protein